MAATSRNVNFNVQSASGRFRAQRDVKVFLPLPGEELTPSDTMVGAGGRDGRDPHCVN